MASPTSFTLELVHDKETSGTHRFRLVETSEPLPFDCLYVKKWAAAQLGAGTTPTTVRVTVEAVA